MPRTGPTDTPSGLTVAGLFSGVGGLERGLARAGFSPVLLCETWEPAQKVLSDRFPDVAADTDVRTLSRLPDADLLAAGFPCTDLSLAGAMGGIDGTASGLVRHVFRLAARTRPPWILLENVPHMLGLHKGAAMRVLTTGLERLGYRWAYRTVDARSAGLPQRRPRVLFAASLDGDPSAVLLAQDAGPRPDDDYDDRAYGFYWTEGRRGLGLVRDATPPLKGGSTIGLGSAPAVWLPGATEGRRFVVVGLAAGERMQGLPRGWTRAAATTSYRHDHRWKLVGNAVAGPVAEWAGRRVASAIRGTLRAAPPRAGAPIDRTARWPAAGWGETGSAWSSDASQWPQRRTYLHLADAVPADAAALSWKATRGFLSRLETSGLPHPHEFMVDLKDHLRAAQPASRP